MAISLGAVVSRINMNICNFISFSSAVTVSDHILWSFSVCVSAEQGECGLPEPVCVSSGSGEQ